MKKVLAFLLACIMLLNLSGCVSSAEAENAVDATLTMDQAAADFAIRLFQNANEAGENTLISPLSVMAALGLTANGARDSTLRQMEDMLGLSVEELNGYVREYLKYANTSQTAKMHLANPVWFKSWEKDLIADEFLQTIGECYNAEAFAVPFNEATLQQINNWVSEHTHGMIPGILDALDGDMYLINALAFEAEWANTYSGNDIQIKEFTREDGTVQEVEMMNGFQQQFIHDEKATGFIKPFQGGDYAFVALLPNEGITVDEYLDYLTGERLLQMLVAAEDKTVVTSIPKFKIEYEKSLKDTLRQMGMADAFSNADFSGFGPIGNSLTVADVLHKTYFSINETGVAAGAATAVILYKGHLHLAENAEYVILDRPFVYMLINCRTNLPVFIGTMMEIPAK